MTIYYKPDMSGSRENWPSELITAKDEKWPPDLSSYVQPGGSIRQVSTYFLYEQLHSELDDTCTCSHARAHIHMVLCT